MQPGPRKALAAPGTRQHCGALVKGKGCPLKSTGQQSIFAQVAGEEAKTRHLGDLAKVKMHSVTLPAMQLVLQSCSLALILR